MAWNDITFTAGQTDYIAGLNTLRTRAATSAGEVETARDGQSTLLANINLRLTQAQVDARVGTLAPLLSGMTADLNAGGFKVTNLGDPALAQDAATRSWVLSQIINGGTGLAYPLEPFLVTAAYTTDPGKWLLVDTSTTAITITLPSGTDGDVIRFTDFAGTWETNNVTLTGGSFLDAEGAIQSADFVLDINNFDVTAVFYSGAWRIR